MNAGEEKSLKTYNEIKDRELRTWNRCVTFFNVLRDSGQQAGKTYLKGFDGNERKDIVLMFTEIRNLGITEVKRKIMNRIPVIGGC